MTQQPESTIAILATSTAEPVTLEAIRRHCNVVADDEDDDLRTLIAAARAVVEQETHLSLVRKTLRLQMPCWPATGRPIELQGSPCVSVTSISYKDEDGNSQTLEQAGNWVPDLDRRPSAVWLAPGASWPGLQTEAHDAVTIQYEAGYKPSDKPAPDLAVHAIKMLVGHWYKQREAIVVGTISKEIELGFGRLVQLLRKERYP